jgi:hypothetical protein
MEQGLIGSAGEVGEHEVVGRGEPLGHGHRHNGGAGSSRTTQSDQPSLVTGRAGRGTEEQAQPWGEPVAPWDQTGVAKFQPAGVGSERDDRGTGRFGRVGEIGIKRFAGRDDEGRVLSARGQPGARLVGLPAVDQLGRPGGGGEPRLERPDPCGTGRGKKQKDVATHRHSHLSMPMENGS